MIFEALLMQNENEMKISKSMNTTDVAKAFENQFKGLSLKFYKKAHEDLEGSPQKLEVDSEVLGQLNGDLTEGTLALSSEMTVSDVEAAFEDQYGLHVQVFRHSGEQWLQTTKTDHWTLAKQMKKADD